MAQLQLFLLGSPRIELDNTPISLPRRKIMALLAYLAVTRQNHRRDTLATLFWSESSHSVARSALRRELHVLNQVLGNEWLVLERDMVGINEKSSLWVDAQQFHLHLEAYRNHHHNRPAICAECEAALIHATTLYQGDFLTGFTLADCPEFDDWQFFESDALRRAYATALEGLVQLQCDRADYDAAISYARRWLALDPAHEPVQRVLIQLYAAAGQQSAALRQYEECVRVLAQELGVPPEAETTALYEAIRSRRFPNDNTARRQPEQINLNRQLRPLPAARSFSLDGEKVVAPAPRPLSKNPIAFVGRDEEWRKLQTAWESAVARETYCVVLTGEAGIGKTRLAEEMLAWVQEQGHDAAYARSYAAQGELAYTPVIDLLRSEPFQMRLAQLGDEWLPHIVRLLPDLLQARPDLPAPAPGMDSWQRQQLFAALAHTVRAVSQPLLLVLDDLQWCDRETLEWLYYLISSRQKPVTPATKLAPLLVLGTIRTGEAGADHPLHRFLWELQRDELLTHIDLIRLNAQETERLGTEVAARQLEPALVKLLHQHTAGNPLFIVETVRAGSKAWEVSGSEGEQPANDVAGAPPPALPAKVYAVIQARLAQLSPQAQEIAGLAAVIGRSFSFDLLLVASQLDEETLTARLDELWQRYILREQGSDGYDFSHDRIRDVVDSQVGRARRRLFHRRIVEAVERTEAHQLDSVSGELAVHCEQAGLIKRAITYFARAARVAQSVGAYQEGIALIGRGLALLETTPDTLEKLVVELAFQLQLAPLQRTALSYASSLHGQTLTRARTLCQLLNKQESLHHVLSGLFTQQFGRAEILEATLTAKELWELAQDCQEPMALMEAGHAMGANRLAIGDFQAAHVYFEQGYAEDDPTQHQNHMPFFGFNLYHFTRSFDTHALWMLGRPNQAAHLIQATIAQARSQAHPFSLALTLAYGAMLYQFRREPAMVQQLAAETIAVCVKHGNPYYQLWATMLHIWAEAVLGNVENKLAPLQQTIEDFKATESRIRLPFYLSLVAELCSLDGKFEQGLAALREAEKLAAVTQESWWTAELHRLRGELLLRQGALPAVVEACFDQSIAIARRQQARLLELRATVSLAGLWQRQGKQRAAHQQLTDLLSSFTEGRDTPDLQAAQTLLKDMTTSL